MTGIDRALREINNLRFSTANIGKIFGSAKGIGNLFLIFQNVIS